MDPKQDYFRSPNPRNLLNFQSPFRLLRHDQDPVSLYNSLSPLNRFSNNYFSQFSPYQPCKEQQQVKVKKQEQSYRPINGLLSFQNQQEEQQQQMGTPQKNPQKASHIQTTSRKKYDLRMIQSHNQKVIFGKDTQKGLRALSRQAYEIFQYSNSMTYQQVAQRIIQQNQQVNQFPEKKKQKQSIKRRIYDALNVLIAVGVLEKVGKKISLSKKMKEQYSKQEDTKKLLTQKFQQKQKFVQNKKKLLQRIKNRRKMLERLVDRNMKLKTQENVHLQKIKFPFIIANQIIVKKGDNLAKINGFLGTDIDAINKLKI